MQDLLDENITDQKNTLRFHWWVTFIWFFFFVIGSGFRIMHWPFAAILIILGAGGFMAYSLSSLILANRKTPLIIICNLIGGSWILFIVWSIIFNNGHPLNEMGLLVQLAAFAILFLIHWGVLYLIKKGRSRNK